MSRAGYFPSSKSPLIVWGSGLHLIHVSLGPPNSTSQTASQSVQSFLYGSRQRVLYFTMGRPFPPQNCPFAWGSGPPSKYHMVPRAHPSPYPKWHFDQFSCFCTADNHDRFTDNATPCVTIGRILVLRWGLKTTNRKQNYHIVTSERKSKADSTRVLPELPI